MQAREVIPAAILFLLITGCQLTAQAPAGDVHARREFGEVLIFSDGPERLVVAMDTDMGAKDGLVDQWFVLQTATPVTETRTHLRSADIFFREGMLRVTSRADQTAYELAVNGAEPGRELPHGYKVVRTEGFGLSRNLGKTALRVAWNERDRCETCESLTRGWGNGTTGSGGASCDSGGPGAKSSSLASATSSASVTCDTPSHACCRTTPAGVTCDCSR